MGAKKGRQAEQEEKKSSGNNSLKIAKKIVNIYINNLCLIKIKIKENRKKTKET